jgi:hypothetical protein
MLITSSFHSGISHVRELYFDHINPPIARSFPGPPADYFSTASADVLLPSSHIHTMYFDIVPPIIVFPSPHPPKHSHDHNPFINVSISIHIHKKSLGLDSANKIKHMAFVLLNLAYFLHLT